MQEWPDQRLLGFGVELHLKDNGGNISVQCDSFAEYFPRKQQQLRAQFTLSNYGNEARRHFHWSKKIFFPHIFWSFSSLFPALIPRMSLKSY